MPGSLTPYNSDVENTSVAWYEPSRKPTLSSGKQPILNPWKPSYLIALTVTQWTFILANWNPGISPFFPLSWACGTIKGCMHRDTSGLHLVSNHDIYPATRAHSSFGMTTTTTLRSVFSWRTSLGREHKVPWILVFRVLHSRSYHRQISSQGCYICRS